MKQLGTILLTSIIVVGAVHMVLTLIAGIIR